MEKDKSIIENSDITKYIDNLGLTKDTTKEEVDKILKRIPEDLFVDVMFQGLLEKGHTFHFFSNFDKLNDSQQRLVVNTLINSENCQMLLLSLDKIRIIDQYELFCSVIKYGKVKSIDLAVSISQTLDFNILIKASLDTGRLDIIKEVIWSFSQNNSSIKISQESTLLLINNGLYGLIGSYIKIFDINDYDLIINLLLEKEDYEGVYFTVKESEGVDVTDVAFKLLDKIHPNSLTHRIGCFKGIDSKKFIDKLIELKCDYHLGYPHFAHYFKISISDFVMFFINAGQEKIIAENLGNYRFLNGDVSNRLIQAGYQEHVDKYSDSFK